MVSLALRLGAGGLTLLAVVAAIAVNGFEARLALVVVAVVGATIAAIGRVPVRLAEFFCDLYGPDADPASQWPITVGLFLAALAIIAVVGGVVYFAR